MLVSDALSAISIRLNYSTFRPWLKHLPKNRICINVGIIKACTKFVNCKRERERERDAVSLKKHFREALENYLKRED